MIAATPLALSLSTHLPIAQTWDWHPSRAYRGSDRVPSANFKKGVSFPPTNIIVNNYSIATCSNGKLLGAFSWVEVPVALRSRGFPSRMLRAAVREQAKPFRKAEPPTGLVLLFGAVCIQ